jgi:hypothetical protein
VKLGKYGAKFGGKLAKITSELTLFAMIVVDSVPIAIPFGFCRFFWSKPPVKFPD